MLIFIRELLYNKSRYLEACASVIPPNAVNEE